jgi:hypothetical protein
MQLHIRGAALPKCVDVQAAVLSARGFRRFSLGARTLRTDTACVALPGALRCLRAGA